MLPILAVLLLQAVPAQEAPPVLEFPEPGVDDPAAYEGYRTRFYRDAAGNTLQIYLDQRDGRVVGVWANSANESVGFTVRDSAGRPAPLAWGGERAVAEAGRGGRSVEYRLRIDAPAIEVGHFLLGSMRVERDFQYQGGHRGPFDDPPFPRPELTQLIANLERLDDAERRRHLSLLRAADPAELGRRLSPTLVLDRADAAPRVRVEHPSFDGRNRLALELRADGADARVARTGRSVAIRSRDDGPIDLVVRVETDAAALTPLRAAEIFDRDFLSHLDSLRAEHARIARTEPAQRSAAERERLLRLRRIERQVRSLELLSSHEKLMAGLPNYGTYFGRDMLMSALMMEPVWSDRMAEYVIGSVLGKLSPTGEVSHEEALGGQAIREHAAEYNALLADHFAHRERGERAAADSSLARARAILADLQAVRENYHMLDDDFQFPVLVARYLAHPAIPAGRKREFLLAPVPGRGGATRLALLLRNFAYVARMAEPYARDPVAANLIAFPARSESAWFPGSWRDSNAGYANGRYAMDINVVWVPAALEALGESLRALHELGFDAPRLAELAPEAERSPLGEHLRSPESLRRTAERWQGTARHFEVTLPPEEVRARVGAKLEWLPAEEARYWGEVLRRDSPVEALRFLALSLDAGGRPVPVLNTDVAMRLYVREPGSGAAEREAVLRDVRAVLRPYPIGLLIPGLGPVVGNDAYAAPEVWEAFRRDHYHSPRVVWGREVNLLLLGLARHIGAAVDPTGSPRRPGLTAYVAELCTALHTIRAAVEASGLSDQELWSYRIQDGRLAPVRYASSTDLQLWNLTDLAVQFELRRVTGAPASATRAAARPDEARPVCPAEPSALAPTGGS